MEAIGDLTVPSPLPVACTLGADDGHSRLMRWQRLAEVAAPVAHLVDAQLEVRYQAAEGVQEELAELAAAEQACCSFVTWSVSAVEGQPVLRVTAPADAPDAVESIAALFGAVPGATRLQ